MIEVLKSIRKEILDLGYYKAGKVVEGKSRRKRIKLSSNENPLGSSPKAIKSIRKQLVNELSLYPDSEMKELKKALVLFFKKRGFYITPENIVFGDGSGEVLHLLFSLFLSEDSTLILPEKSFILYYLQSKSKGAKLVEVERNEFLIDLERIEKAINQVNGKKMVVFANPDNPTSTLISKDRVREFLSRIPDDVAVVIDEAYIHFSGFDNSVVDLIYDYKNLIVVQTLSKAFGLAGLRVGYGIMNKEIVEQIEKIRLPFNLGTLQQVGAVSALKDNRFLEKTLKYIAREREYLKKNFRRLGFKFPEPEANFFLLDLGDRIGEIIESLSKKGISLRHLVDFGYPERFVRISIGLHDENKKLLKVLKKFRFK